MLKVKNISYSYDKSAKIIKNFSFEMKTKELISFVGKSGVGKSTLMSLLNGELKADNGQVLLDGKDITKTMPQQRPIVTMFQGENLFPHLNVIDNILFGLKAKFNKERFKDIGHKSYSKALLAEVELSGFESKYPHELSGGQKQRVALARSIAIKPKLLLLDEPFSALDPQLKFSLNKLVKKIVQQNDIMAIKITHDLDEALTYSDRIVLLSEDNISESNPVSITKNPPNKEFIKYFKNAYLIDENNFILSQKINSEKGDYSLKFRVLSKQAKGHLYEYLLDINGQSIIYYTSTDLDQGEALFYNRDDIIGFVY